MFNKKPQTRKSFHVDINHCGTPHYYLDIAATSAQEACDIAIVKYMREFQYGASDKQDIRAEAY